MRNEFDGKEAATHSGVHNWPDFLANMKRAKLSVLSPRTRGEYYSFAHLVEFDFQARLGSKYSRELAKLVFFKFINTIIDGRSVRDLEDNPELFSDYIKNPHVLIFSRETANDPTLFLTASAEVSIAEIQGRFLRLALDGVGTDLSRRVVSASAESLIVYDVTSALRRLTTEV